MATVPISMTLPSELAQMLREKADNGEIRSVSSYAADAIAERLQREADAARGRARVDDYLAKYLTAPDEESDAFVADVIADLTKKAGNA
ncbi:hypothetical protein LO763_22465 [Glycomyces sp. A-F 0318]|uniref:hypothetical protein n=1 Tax=Glycomyces amatae TaxID=2881355 RepID=UPI001E3EA3D6|nr:hypothetical protein [Glycomyces amatae]MCD0446383.1 hypothetical protein [Glycomyces amatae]